MGDAAVSRFFVGQRVKKARGFFVGMTGRVAGFGHSRPDDMLVTLDAPAVNESGQTFVPGEEAVVKPDQWEPILPDGAAPSEFITLRDLLNSLEGVHA